MRAGQAGLSTCSMAMCSLILMSILKTGPCMVSEEEEAVFMAQCNAFATGCAACIPCLT